MKKLLLSLCILLLWGCKGQRQAESGEAIDSLVEEDATADTAKVDTVGVDTLAKESEVSADMGDEDGVITTWHHLTKTLYEVEFCSPKLRQDIDECFNKFEKRIESMANAGDPFAKQYVGTRYFDLYIDSTHVCIEALYGKDIVNYLVIDPQRIPILGYSNFGQRIAIVYKTPFAVCTNSNPIDLTFKWYTSVVTDPSKVRIDAIDDTGIDGFDINPEDYAPCDSSSAAENE